MKGVIIKPREFRILCELSPIYDTIEKRYRAEQEAIGSRIPAGGGEWMDLFFRLEGIRGVLESLRKGETIEQALKRGKEYSTIAVRKWNSRREYQVHRWDECAHDFIETTLRKIIGVPGNG